MSLFPIPNHRAAGTALTWKNQVKGPLLPCPKEKEQPESRRKRNKGHMAWGQGGLLVSGGVQWFSASHMLQATVGLIKKTGAGDPLQ